MRALKWRSNLRIAVLAIGLTLLFSSCTWPGALRSDEVPPTVPITSTQMMSGSVTLRATQAISPTQTPSLTGTPRLTPSPAPILTGRPTATLVPTAVALAGSLVYVAAPHSIENGAVSLSETTDIYSLSLETGESQQLTAGNYRNLQPVWSPNGDQVAFISDRDGNLDLYMMNSDGSGVIRLTDSVENEGHPTWSPDGTQIVFDRTQEVIGFGKISHLYTVSLSDKMVRQLTSSTDNDYYPSWSPDGRYLAFNRDVHHIEGDQHSFEPYVYLLDMTDGSEIPLTKALFNQVPFATAEDWQQVWLMDPVWLPASGDGHLSLTQLPARCNEGGVIAVFEIDWSPTQPSLKKLIEISGGFEGYTWGSSGAWIISSEYGYHSQNVPSSQPDLSARHIGTGLSQPKPVISTSDPVAQRAPCLGFEETEWLTETTLYESAPDWKP